MARLVAQRKTVTIKTIADHLGVSSTTVARSLKDGRKISPEMIAKVRQAADELGYVPNLDGVKLRTGKTFVLMSFLSFPPDEEIGDSGSVGLLNGIHQRCAETHYSLRAVPVEIGQSAMNQLQQVVFGRNADGIILDHTQPQDERVKFLLEHDVPFVTFGRTELYTPHPYFDIDNEFAAFQGTAAMVDKGKTRICLLDGSNEYAFVQQRVRGYRAALEKAGLPFDPRLLQHMRLEPQAAREAAHRMVAEHGADAFVCLNELILLGARAGVRMHGEDRLAQTAFSMRSGANIGEYLGTSISSSYYSRVKAGWKLADFLLKRIDGAPVETVQEIVRTDLKNHDHP